MKKRGDTHTSDDERGPYLGKLFFRPLGLLEESGEHELGELTTCVKDLIEA